MGGLPALAAIFPEIVVRVSAATAEAMVAPLVAAGARVTREAAPDAGGWLTP